MKAKIELEGKMYDAELTPIEEQKTGRVEIGKCYFSVGLGGIVVKLIDQYAKFDDYNYNTGNYYYTEEEAEQALTNQKKVIEMRKWLKEQQGDWKPDWNNGSQNNYFISHEFKVSEFYTDYSDVLKYLPDWKYIKTGEIAEEMITKFGNDLHLWIEA